MAAVAANTNTGNPISWSAALQYSTSAYATTGTGTSITDGPRTFNTASGQQQEEIYQNQGGQVSVTASTTASDGSTIQDCETFYIEGPAGGIPGPATPTNPQDVITPELASLYTGSPSYPTDGSGTSNLMTGIAWRETQYRQFESPADNPPNSDLFNLKADLGVDYAKWPDENSQTSQSPRGKYIGLMQMATAAVQTGKGGDPNAWNWTQNAIDAVNLFSGNPAPNKMDLAAEYENDIVGGVKNPKIPAHIGLGEMIEQQLEDMALVLYAGDIPSGLAEQDMLDMQYYIPVCTPPGSITSASKGWECSTQWYWAVNDSQVDSNVQAGNIFPSGYVFPPGVTGIFDNQQGVAYVSVVRANLH